MKEKEKEIINHIASYLSFVSWTPKLKWKIRDTHSSRSKISILFFDVIPILWCYTQIKNSKHVDEEDRDNWPEMDRLKRSDRQRGSKADRRRGFKADRQLGTAGGSVASSFGGGDVEDESGGWWWNREVRVWESKLERHLREGEMRASKSELRVTLRERHGENKRI